MVYLIHGIYCSPMLFITSKLEQLLPDIANVMSLRYTANENWLHDSVTIKGAPL